MGTPEAVKPEQFDAEPGQVTDSRGPASATPAPEAGGTNVDDEGYLIDPGGAPPTTEPPANVASETNTAEEAPALDIDAILAQNEQLRTQNENLQRMTGDQGRRIGELENVQKVLGNMAQRPGNEYDDSMDEPLTKADAERIKAEMHQEAFLLKTQERDDAFKAVKNLTPEIISAVESVRKQRGIISFKDAYGAMVYEKTIVEPDATPAPTTPPVRPARKVPVQASGSRRAPASPALDMERFDAMNGEEALASLKKEFYPELS